MRPDPFPPYDLAPYDVGLVAGPDDRGWSAALDPVLVGRLVEAAGELGVEARRLAQLTSTPALTGPCGAALRHGGALLAAQLSALASRAEALAARGRAR